MTDRIEAPEIASSPVRDPSIWEDLVDILFSPREVFERRRLSGYGGALLLLTILFVILTPLMQMSIAGIGEATVRAALEARGVEVTAEQLQRMGRFSLIGSAVSPLIIVPVSALLGGLILWGLGSLAKVRMSIRAATVITVWSAFPRAAAMVANTIEASLHEPERITQLSFGPARFLGANASPLLAGVLGRLDLFTLWTVVLTVIGIVAIGRIEDGQTRNERKVGTGRAVVLAAGLWLVGSVPAVFGAFAAGFRR
ncbi:MAG: YIP1 family protein [Gemmatimonadota bacterium]|jgi:hypothetical protein|nr:YIP1 family protein [Gemmatimonadota bacterium]